MERQQQARRLQGSAGVGAVGPGATVAPTAAATAAADSNQPGFSAGADSELERLYRAAERHTQREREAAMELQRKRELKEAIANRKAAAKTFSVVHHRHPREVDREHIALLKKRFRFGSLPPPACPPRSKDLTLRHCRVANLTRHIRKGDESDFAYLAPALIPVPKAFEVGSHYVLCAVRVRGVMCALTCPRRATGATRWSATWPSRPCIASNRA